MAKDGEWITRYEYLNERFGVVLQAVTGKEEP